MLNDLVCTGFIVIGLVGVVSGVMLAVDGLAWICREVFGEQSITE